MRAVANVLANWTAFIVGTAITFVLSPFVVAQLGDTRFGLWALVVSLVGYLGLLDLGIRVTVTRFVAHHAAKGDQDAVNRVVSTALGVFIAAGVVASILGVVAAFALPALVDIPADTLHEARIACALSGVTVAGALIGGVYGGIIAGLQRLTLLNAIELATELLRAAAVFAVLSAGGDLVSLALIQLGAVAVRGVAARVAARRLQPDLRISRAAFDKARLREIVRFSSFTMILHVSAIFIFSSDAVVIAAILPVAQVTIFVIAANLIQAVFRVLGGVSQALYPLVSARQATDGTLAAAGLLTRTMRLGALAVLPIVLTFVTRGASFIGLWMGPEYAGPSGGVLVILSVGLCVFASYHLLTQAMIALDLHRGMAPAYVGEAVANVVLSVVLGLAFGLPGVAWGTTVPRLLVGLGFGPWYARRTLRIPGRVFAVHAWLRPLAAMLPYAAASAALDAVWPAANLGMFFLQVALLLPLAAAGAWTVGMERDERMMVREGLPRLLTRLPFARRPRGASAA